MGFRVQDLKVQGCRVYALGFEGRGDFGTVLDRGGLSRSCDWWSRM